jgi:low temperature requirement protein LtrA
MVIQLKKSVGNLVERLNHMKLEFLLLPLDKDLMNLDSQCIDSSLLVKIEDFSNMMSITLLVTTNSLLWVTSPLSKKHYQPLAFGIQKETQKKDFF